MSFAFTEYRGLYLSGDAFGVDVHLKEVSANRGREQSPGRQIGSAEILVRTEEVSDLSKRGRRTDVSEFIK